MVSRWRSHGAEGRLGTGAGRGGHGHGRGTSRGTKRNLERGGDRCRSRHDIADQNAGIGRGERRAGQIRAGEGDVDRFASVAGIRREGGDRRGTDAARVARDGEQIADRVIRIRRDISLPIDHLGQAAQVVVDVVGLVGDRS